MKWYRIAFTPQNHQFDSVSAHLWGFGPTYLFIRCSFQHPHILEDMKVGISHCFENSRLRTQGFDSSIFRLIWPAQWILGLTLRKSIRFGFDSPVGYWQVYPRRSWVGAIPIIPAPWKCCNVGITSGLLSRRPTGSQVRFLSLPLTGGIYG